MKKILLFSSVLLVGLSNSNAQTKKNCLIEEFTSSTCTPCAGMNAWLDPLLATKNANVEGSGLVVLKYQMDFPPPGNDASFNAHGDKRASTYIAGMTQWGIPLHFTNGKYKDTTSTGGTSSATVTNELNTCGGTNAQMEITGTYSIKAISSTKDSVFISITVTPKATLTGTFKLFVAATEQFYQNTATTTGHYTSQTDFHHVMRRMFPDGAGTTISTFTANTPQTFTFKQEVVIGANAKGNFNWWGNPYNGSVVAFVSDMSKPVRAQANVLQAQAIHAKWATNVADVANFQNINVAPNPATNMVGVFFNLTQAAEIAVTVSDITGRVVYTQAPKHFGTDAEKIIIPTDNMANGNYFIQLRSEKGTMTQQFVIQK